MRALDDIEEFTVKRLVEADHHKEWNYQFERVNIIFLKEADVVASSTEEFFHAERDESLMTKQISRILQRHSDRLQTDGCHSNEMFKFCSS